MWQEYRNWMARSGPAFLVALIACSVAHGQDVRTIYMPGTDFSKYRTYKWVTIGESGAPNQIIDTQIKQSIDSQLRAKGFIKVDSDEADVPRPAALGRPTDLLVRYQVAINRERQWNAYGWGDGFPWRGMGTAMGTATSSTIHVGTLVLDIYDPAAKQLVWEGSATKTINPSKDQQKNQKNLDKAITKLLKDFPPRWK
jgi:hypothetical protein